VMITDEQNKLRELQSIEDDKEQVASLLNYSIYVTGAFA